MVVADGTVKVANERENADLFWAIRGGGCNFGVAAELVFQLHDQRPTVYSGVLVYPPPLVDAVLKVTAEWWKKGPGPKTSLLQVMSRGPPPDFAVSLAVSPLWGVLIGIPALRGHYSVLQWHSRGRPSGVQGFP